MIQDKMVNELAEVNLILEVKSSDDPKINCFYIVSTSIDSLFLLQTKHLFSQLFVYFLYLSRKVLYAYVTKHLCLHFLIKQHFACQKPLNRYQFQLFLMIAFSKTHGTGLYARVTPKKDLKQALLSKFSFNINFHIYLIYLSFAFFLIHYCSLPLVLNTRTLH